MRSDQRIQGLFESLRPRLAALDERRRRLRNTVVGGVVVAALGVGSCSFAFDPPPALAEGALARFGPLAFAALSLVCFGFAFARFLVPGITGHVNYRAHFKKDVVADVVRVLQPGARYYPDRHLKRELFDASRLFRTGLATFRGDDMLQGVVGDTPYECSELQASYTSGTGKNRTTHRVFSGLFFRIDLDEDLSGHTVVQPPTAAGGDREGMERLAMDELFDGAFATWSTRREEALRLLTPATRGGLLELQERAGAKLHVAFTGRVAYAALDYGRGLFEPRIASALKEADLQALAAPIDLADDVVRALGLGGQRRRPADAGFHKDGAQVTGLEAVAERVAKEGDVGMEALAEAMAADEGPEVVEPPTRPFAQLAPTGGGLEVRYPWAFGTLFALSVWLLLTPVFLAALGNWLRPDMLAPVLERVVSRWPQAREPIEAVLASKTAFLLVSALFWWGFGSTVRHRPAVVSVGPEGVEIRRMLRPWSLRVPASVIRRVEGSNQRVSVVRTDRSFLLSMVPASPLLGAEEARWVAAQMTSALRRSGWSRPVARPPAT